MNRVMVIAPSLELTASLGPVLAGSKAAVLVKEYSRYPSLEELAGAIRAHEPHCVFVDVASDPSAVRVAGEMQRRWPATGFVAVDLQTDPAKLVDLLRAGIREFLAAPFDEAELRACLDRVRSRSLARDPGLAGVHTATNGVYAFVPAKPGAGASTLAIQTALAFARLEGNRTLLVDCDLGCGVVGFHLKVQHQFSVQDALERASILEPGVWADLVAQTADGKLDVLSTAPPGPCLRPTPASVAPFCEFARRCYDTIVLDCSGDLDQFQLELLSQCRRILLVAKAELTTVHMGREKLRVLQAAELDDRAELVINRWRKNSMLSLADIEGVFGIAAEHLIPEDGKSAYRSVLRGSGADPLSPLGQACTGIQEALGAPVSQNHTAAAAHPAEARPKKRMVEYFAVSPARYALFPNADSPAK